MYEDQAKKLLQNKNKTEQALFTTSVTSVTHLSELQTLNFLVNYFLFFMDLMW